jgi:Bacterial aa3 type cytochrome c oxidase subunit IV
MAADHTHHGTDQHDSPAMDYAEHDKTFALFAMLCTWVTVGSVVFVLIVGAITGIISWLFALTVSGAMAFIAKKFF